MNTIEGTRLWTLSEGGHYQGVDTIERTRLCTLSEGRETGGGDRSCRETGGGARLVAVIVSVTIVYRGEQKRGRSSPLHKE